MQTRHRLTFVAMAAAAFAFVLAMPVHASDTYIATVTANDSGSAISPALCTNSSGCGGKQLAIQCDFESHYKTCQFLNPCDAGMTDLLLPQQPKVMDVRMQGDHRYLSIYSNDGGTVNCKLYDVNPPTLPTNP